MDANSEWNIENLTPSAWAVAVARSRQSRTKSDSTRDIFAEEFLTHASRLVPADYLYSFGLSAENSITDIGNISSMQIRSYFFDNYINEANSDNIRQTVLLGAGFDTRAFNLDWPKESILYELDLPDMINFKEQVISQMRVAPKCVRRALPTDLRKNWEDALVSSGFSANVPTAWIAEGLFHGLHNDDQWRLAHQITELSAPGSRLAFQYFANFTELMERTLRNNHEDIARKINNNKYLKSAIKTCDLSAQGLIRELRSKVSDVDTMVEIMQEMGWKTQTETAAKLSKRYGIDCSGTPTETDRRVQTQFVTATLE